MERGAEGIRVKNLAIICLSALLAGLLLAMLILWWISSGGLTMM